MLDHPAASFVNAKDKNDKNKDFCEPCELDHERSWQHFGTVVRLELNWIMAYT